MKCTRECAYPSWHAPEHCKCEEHAAVNAMRMTLELIVDKRHAMTPGEMAHVALEALAEYDSRMKARP